jgi:hypothetical protein
MRSDSSNEKRGIVTGSAVAGATQGMGRQQWQQDSSRAGGLEQQLNC